VYIQLSQVHHHSWKNFFFEKKTFNIFFGKQNIGGRLSDLPFFWVVHCRKDSQVRAGNAK